MAGSHATAKGNALEAAVALIERTILAQNPALREATITIETKKILVADDVRHEIDVHVMIDLGRGYKSVFLFECKNWDSDIIGKNEVIILSEKINAYQGQTGFLIGKKFSKDARAQARKDKRIELLTVDHGFSDLISFPELHHVVQRNVRCDLLFPCEVSSPDALGDFDAEAAVIKLNGEIISIHEFRERLMKATLDERMKREPTERYPVGSYDYTHKKEFPFDPNELIVDGFGCRSVEIFVQFEVLIIRPRIVSRFDVKSRGRVLTYERVVIPEVGDVDLSLVSLE
jgi:hypothetical protein